MQLIELLEQRDQLLRFLELLQGDASDVGSLSYDTAEIYGKIELLRQRIAELDGLISDQRGITTS